MKSFSQVQDSNGKVRFESLDASAAKDYADKLEKKDGIPRNVVLVSK